MYYISNSLVWAGAFSAARPNAIPSGDFYEKYMQTHDFGVFVMGVRLRAWSAKWMFGFSRSTQSVIRGSRALALYVECSSSREPKYSLSGGLLYIQNGFKIER